MTPVAWEREEGEGGVYIFSVVRSCWSGWIELYERRSEDDDKSRGLVMEEEEQRVSSS